MSIERFHTAGVADYSLERDRIKIPDDFRWDLTAIYPDDAAWKNAKQRFIAELPEFERYRGTLTESAQTLFACLDLASRLGKEYTRLYCYASMNSDLDTRNAAYLGMEQEMSALGADFGAKSSFIEPEILKVDKSTIDAFIAREPKLEIYRHNLYDTLRRKEHTGSEGEEKIIADAGLMSDAPGSVYNIFSNADFPFPEIELHDGKKVKLDQSAFALHKSDAHREDRKKIFAAYFGKLNEFRRTFGTNLFAEIKKNMFFMRARKYPSCLEHALDGGNIPVAVYKGLIENVNANLDTFHRYLSLRKKLLGVNELHYYDLYAPLVKDIDLKYQYDEAWKHVLASLTPLGGEYISVSRKCFDERWVDVFPNEGKRSGAYSNGAVYDVHPYILLNYNGKYDDVSTLTHELGHTMHSYFSNKHQPYPTSHYSIFVAEVASTFNEALLMDYMLKTISDPDIRLSLLGNYLDGIRGTVFRQVQFSEFELAVHERAERGEALTGDAFSELYDSIAKRYYGHDKGVCVVDDMMPIEWAHIPHFYYHFYVYQYATSFTASAALSEQILAGDIETTKRYMQLLSSGGSDYPIALLKKAGIDMTTSLPFDLTIKKMNRVMDEIEQILGKKS
ncbi:MAG: oligoendopeptidase F [Bacteroidetes bacterium]|nr:oligoendopeptidase F [Bacteroidota bacterium]MCW5895690.1 oligoendopeptidase F [Bacteroidota bacterium]